LNRVATIDIGTNTALLLIAELKDGGRNPELETLFHDQAIVRLGQGVDRHKRIHPDAIQRLIEAIRKFQASISSFGAEETIAVATSAMRDAENREEVRDQILNETGLRIQILSGTDEATYTCLGAVAGFELTSNPYLVMDIGGGSTELVLANKHGILDSISMDMGCVRLTERLFSSQPPNESEYLEAKHIIISEFHKNLSRFIQGREQVFAVAGTPTSLVKVVEDMPTYEINRIHGYALSYAQVEQLLEKLKNMSVQQIIDFGVEPGRADVFTIGVLIVHQFMRLFGAPTIRVSVHGLRYGVAMKELQASNKFRVSKSKLN